jgi:hypothetical protein
VIDEFEEPEPKITKADSKKLITKTTKHEEYDMNIYLFHLNSQTECTNEDRIEIFNKEFDTNITDMKIANTLKPYFKVHITRINNKQIKVFQVNCTDIKQFEIDEFEEPEPKITKKATKITTKKSKSTIEKKIDDFHLIFQQELEEDIGKQVNDLQEKDPNINLIEKYRCRLMKKQKRANNHFNIAEFIEELMEEERTGVKKEEKKMIGEGSYHLEDDISIDNQDKLRDA